MALSFFSFPTMRSLRLPSTKRALQSLAYQRSRSFAGGNFPKQEVFNRDHKRIHRDNAASKPTDELARFEYVHSLVASELIDRLKDITGGGSIAGVKGGRTFPTALEIGSRLASGGIERPGELPRLVKELTDAGDITTLHQTDISSKMLHRDDDCYVQSSTSPKVKVIKEVMDEEKILQSFKEKSLDLVISNLNLHWVNDLPTCFTSIRKVLREDGLFLASMFGEFTLQELRNAFLVAEQEREGGISPHVSPLVRVSDVGNLLTSAGFALTTIDAEEITVNYPDAFALMYELQQMGENNALKNRRNAVPKETLLSMAAAYQGLYGNPDGSIPATFHIVYMIGWAPHTTQQKPKARGSAEFSLKDLGKVDMFVEDMAEKQLAEELQKVEEIDDKDSK